MNLKYYKRKYLSGILALMMTIAPIHSAHAIFGIGDIVFDPQNYGQNLISAARALQQINNQITQLHNEAQMLLNQSKNLTSLPSSIAGNLQTSLLRMDALIRTAHGMAYQISSIDAQFSTLYPEAYSAATTNSQVFLDGQNAWKQARQGFQHSLHVQAEVTEQVREDQILLEHLVGESQGAVGSLQVAQAGNQLTALSAKQVMQLQTLMASTARADALDRAAVLAVKEQARVQFTNFLGDNSAYTP